MTTVETFRQAFNTRNSMLFLDLIFPPEWKAIRSRILESGVLFSNDQCAWAPRWSKVPPTIRHGQSELEGHVKSCIYRAHDFIHQLWGLPHPDPNFTEEGFRVYKRSQMCGEVAVLTLTEFVLVPRLAEMHPTLRPFLEKRNAIPMLEGPLKGRSVEQVAARLDTLLHKKKRPSWVRNHASSTAFCDDYVPMLQHDRDCIDHNWKLLKAQRWENPELPNAPYSQDLDGLELTTWMIRDFFHQMDTGPETDDALAVFNRNRRGNLSLPSGWNEPLIG